MNPETTPAASPLTDAEGEKSYILTWLLAYFVGSLGIDRFYRGLIGTGILKLITLGGLGFWTFIDWLIAGFGQPRDKHGLLLKGFHQNRKTMQIITAVMLVLGCVLVPVFILLMVFLAVPALQQNSRNTQRANDVANIAVAIDSYKTQNSSQLPTSSSQLNLSQLGYYRSTDIAFYSHSPSLQATTIDHVLVVEGVSCNTDSSGLGEPSSNSVAILYGTELSSSTLQQRCLTA